MKRLVCVVLLIATVATVFPDTSWAEDRPNVVFVLTDDQRADAMSCAGHPYLKTPNIDRLAEEGIRFPNHFC
ncbi:MAG: sulfatase-like hydrolase/transferase, partial [Planctomycetota bacterium]